jgi:hypothetical protein
MFLVGNEDMRPENQKKKFILFEGEPYYGLYSNLMRLAEWLYIVKNDKKLGMVIDLKKFFKLEENFMDLFFLPIDDPQIKFSRDRNPVSLKIRGFPGYPIFYNKGLCSVKKRKWVKQYPTDGLSSFEKKRRVLNDATSYSNPQIHIYRERLYSLIKEFLRPQKNIEEKISSSIQILRSSVPGSTKQPYVIGIHLRMPSHYFTKNGKNHFDENVYLDEVEKSIDHLIGDRDLKSLKLYVSTINQPVLDRLSMKYHVTVSNIPRSSKLNSDWKELLEQTDSFKNAEGAILDAWVLS